MSQSSTTETTGNELDASSHYPTVRQTTRASKRRTKTGCITCRRRRIKCGEERPTCSNCTKSRRACEGYDKAGPAGFIDPSIGSTGHAFHDPESLRSPIHPDLSRNAQSFLHTHQTSQTIPHGYHSLGVGPAQPAFGYIIHPHPVGHLPPPIVSDPPLYPVYSNGQTPICQEAPGLLGHPTSLGHFPSGSDTYPGADIIPYNHNVLIHRNKFTKATTTYTSRPTDMPFADPSRRHLLRHYLQFTGPMLSIFERDLPDPSAMFLDKSNREPRKNFWTFFVPSIAMLSPPLAYAICAVSSLQYDKQVDRPTGKSSEYYHEAITRLSNAIGLPTRRSEVSLLIATLLLGYYEVMSAEHKSWNSHVLGSKQLISEIRFGDTKERIRLLDLRNRRTKSAEAYAEEVPLSHKYYWDEDLIATLMGRPSPNSLEDDLVLAQSQPELTDGDLRRFEAQQNLFWWFTKQDIYRSVLSGLPLLRPYAEFGACPPRAAFNDAERPCGTADHLFLLLSRVADFSARDRRRKLTPKRSDSGSKTRSNADTTSKTPEPSSKSDRPAMYGLIPPPPLQTMPPGYIQHHLPSPVASVVSGDDNFDAAIATWTSLHETMTLFHDLLGQDFRPIPTDGPHTTPFGPALVYKSSPIAVMWALYYMGMIILHRNHPKMPPIATQALAAAACSTAEYADMIGRITAGISSSSIDPQRGTLYMASLIELTICIFFAGVQFMDPGRRAWTITMLKHIDKVCGWETALAIAAGCEIFWEGAALMGGPPYVRTVVEKPRPNPPSSAPCDADPPERVQEVREASPVRPPPRQYIIDQAGGNRRYAMGVLEGIDELSIQEPIRA